jgi:hypothetical protein
MCTDPNYTSRMLRLKPFLDKLQSQTAFFVCRKLEVGCNHHGCGNADEPGSCRQLLTARV